MDAPDDSLVVSSKGVGIGGEGETNYDLTVKNVAGDAHTRALIQSKGVPTTHRTNVCDKSLTAVDGQNQKVRQS